MCHNAILPTTIDPSEINNELIQLTYTFNRWLKMLTSYGKLDATGLNEDFTLIAKVLKQQGIKKDVKRTIRRCRDYALARVLRVEDLVRSLISALNMLCKTQVSKEIRHIEKEWADQGMTERYRPLSRRLAREKIRKIGREVIFTDRHTDDRETTRLVRRIVEKRAAQAVHKFARKMDRQSNRFRQSVRRATSFSLYNKSFADYDARLRAPGTHWKFADPASKGKRRLVAKFSYNTCEEAEAACKRFVENHPNDPRPMSAYRCDYCGKWHIGHRAERPDSMEIDKIQQAG